MVINMGPQHPSTHGVLRLVIEIDGETIVSLAPDIGYLHTGIEKTCEAKFYQQVVPLTDRIDYLCPMTNNLAYCLAVEKLLGLEIPERAQYLRVLFNELTRIQSHLVWLGTHAMDIGALTVFLYCFREREELLRIFEAVSGQRMMTSYFRVGGLSLEPPRDLYEQDPHLPQGLPRDSIDEYEGLLQTQSHLDEPAQGRWLSLARGRDCAGRHRASAARLGRRLGRAPRHAVLAATRSSSSTCRSPTVGDVWARYIVRMQEMRESVKICLQALDGLAEGPHRRGCAEDHPSRPRTDEDADGIAHPSLQDCDGRLWRSGG